MAPEESIYYRMHPRAIKPFLSATMSDKKTIDSILVALVKYNKAINAANKTLESDLTKCKNAALLRNPILKKKTGPKKKPVPKKKT